VKVAIIHDVYLHLGGAERVLHALIKMYPQADIYISILDKKYKQQLQKTSSGDIYHSPLSFLPLKQKLSSLLKPLVFLYWESLNLSSYDLVISSSHSFSAKSVSTPHHTKHISYIHTPPRYLYQEFNEMNWIKKNPWKYIFSPLISWLRKKDFAGAQKPDKIIANSQTIKNRIKRYYQRESEAIYPPIKAKKYQLTKKKGQYYLFHARLSKQKGCDVAIKAFNQIGEKLVVVGAGKELSNLKKIAGSNIFFKGFVADKKMPKIYQQAIALIAPYQDEDFGLTPVEAMNHGVPVIGFNSGGLQETIIHKKTGVLFDQLSPRALIKVIHEFKSIKFSPKNCRNQALKFNEERFIKQMQIAINQVINGK